MIERREIFSMPFYKKEAFTGSDAGLRFWIGKTDVEDPDTQETKTVLRAILWPEPFALAHTADEKKVMKDFSFDTEGLDMVYDWIINDGRRFVLHEEENE